MEKKLKQSDKRRGQSSLQNQSLEGGTAWDHMTEASSRECDQEQTKQEKEESKQS